MGNFDYEKDIGFFNAKPFRPAGFLKIGDSNFLPCEKKPNRFHLFIMRVLFGWTWEDLR